MRSSGSRRRSPKPRQYTRSSIRHHGSRHLRTTPRQHPLHKSHTTPFNISQRPITLKWTPAEDLPTPLESKPPNIFMEFSTSTKSLGYVEFELYDDKAPRLCYNFRTLATSRKLNPIQSVYGYLGSTIHHIGEDFWVHGGDFQLQNGLGWLSAYGGAFYPDPWSLKAVHQRPGLLSSVAFENTLAAAAWMVTLDDMSAVDETCGVFGHVTQGLDIFYQISRLPATAQDAPVDPIWTKGCGEVLSTLEHLFERYNILEDDYGIDLSFLRMEQYQHSNQTLQEHIATISPYIDLSQPLFIPHPNAPFRWKTKIPIIPPMPTPEQEDDYLEKLAQQKYYRKLANDKANDQYRVDLVTSFKSPLVMPQYEPQSSTNLSLSSSSSSVAAEIEQEYDARVQFIEDLMNEQLSKRDRKNRKMSTKEFMKNKTLAEQMLDLKLQENDKRGRGFTIQDSDGPENDITPK